MSRNVFNSAVPFGQAEVKRRGVGKTVAIGAAVLAGVFAISKLASGARGAGKAQPTIKLRTARTLTSLVALPKLQPPPGIMARPWMFAMARVVSKGEGIATTRNIEEQLNPTCRNYTITGWKAGSQRVHAGIPVMPGDLGMTIYDRERKAPVDVLWSNWVRDGQMTVKGMFVHHEDRPTTKPLGASWWGDTIEVVRLDNSPQHLQTEEVRYINRHVGKAGTYGKKFPPEVLNSILALDVQNLSLSGRDPEAAARFRETRSVITDLTGTSYRFAMACGARNGDPRRPHLLDVSRAFKKYAHKRREFRRNVLFAIWDGVKAVVAVLAAFGGEIIDTAIGAVLDALGDAARAIVSVGMRAVEFAMDVIRKVVEVVKMVGAEFARAAGILLNNIEMYAGMGQGKLNGYIGELESRFPQARTDANVRGASGFLDSLPGRYGKFAKSAEFIAYSRWGIDRTITQLNAGLTLGGNKFYYGDSRGTSGLNLYVEDGRNLVGAG